MEFFNLIRRKLGFWELLIGILLLVMAASTGGIVFLTSSWLLFGLCGLLSLAGVSGAVYAFGRLVKNPEYRKLMDSVGKIGDPETVGNALRAARKNPYAIDGDLRCADGVLFYWNGFCAWILGPGEITGVKALIEDRGCSVCLRHHNKELRIKTSRDDLLLLAEDLCQQVIVKEAKA